MINTPATPLTDPIVPRAPKPAPKPPPGYWRYHGDRHTRTTFVIALALSGGLHAAALLGFNHHAAPKKAAVQQEEDVIALVMPDLKDLDEPEPEIRDSSEPPPDPGLSVPTLADVPMTVDLSTAFVQQIDYSTLAPKPDLNAAKAITIPTHINRGGGGGAGLGTVFNLADLDRNPEPYVKVAPQVPQNLKHEGFEGKVTVGFIVTAKGEVVESYIIKSSNVQLEDAAVLAISKWKFRPGVKGGRKVNVRMVQPFLFKVTDTSD